MPVRPQRVALEPLVASWRRSGSPCSTPAESSRSRESLTQRRLASAAALGHRDGRRACSSCRSWLKRRQAAASLRRVAAAASRAVARSAGRSRCPGYRTDRLSPSALENGIDACGRAGALPHGRGRRPTRRSLGDCRTALRPACAPAMAASAIRRRCAPLPESAGAARRRRHRAQSHEQPVSARIPPISALIRRRAGFSSIRFTPIRPICLAKHCSRR